MVAQSKGLELVVTTVDHTVIVEADRQILAAALANLVQNALKFTAPRTTVRLRASTTMTRVIIEVEDSPTVVPANAANDEWLETLDTLVRHPSEGRNSSKPPAG